MNGKIYFRLCLVCIVITNVLTCCLASAMEIEQDLTSNFSEIEEWKKRSQEERDWELLKAVKQGLAEKVQVLLAAGARIDGCYAVDCLGGKPLHCAAEKGNLKIVHALLDKDADAVNHCDRLGYTPLHDAADKGHLEIVHALLAAKANIDDASNVNRETPLHRAALMGHVDVINVLLSKNADVYAKDWGYRTPCHWAFAMAHRDASEVLLRNTPDLTRLNIEQIFDLEMRKITEEAIKQEANRREGVIEVSESSCLQ